LKRGELPSIDGLTAFVAAAEHGSFTRAADQLNLSQGAISRQVREIELHLGVRLFERIRQRIVLTDAGRVYVSQVKKALHDLAEASRSVTSVSNSTILNLVALPTFAGIWLVPRLSKFQTQNPNITLHITTRQSPIDYSSEPFDAAVFHGAPHWPGTISYHLMDEDLVAVASPTLCAGRIIKMPSDVTKFRLLHNMGSSNRWAEWLTEAGVEITEPPQGHMYQNYAMIAQAAAAAASPTTTVSALGAATSSVKREVDQNPPGVSLRVIHSANTRPAPGDLEQALLNEVLGLSLVPDDQVRGPEQLIDVSRDEVVKVGHHSA